MATIEQQRALAIAQAKRRRAESGGLGVAPVGTSEPADQSQQESRGFRERARDMLPPLLRGENRQLELASRNVVEGALTLPSMAANALGGVSNYIMDLTDRVIGNDAPEEEKFRFIDQAQNIHDTLTRLGVPEPETETEKLISKITQTGVAAGTGMGLGGVLAKSASPVTAGVGKSLGAAPVAQLAGSVTGPVAGEVAEAAGAGPVVQTVAEIAGGVAPALKRGAVRGPSVKEELSSVEGIKEAQTALEGVSGVKVPIFKGQATQTPSDLLNQRYLQQLAPTSRNALNQLQKQDDDVFKATIGVLDTIAPEEAIEVAGRQIRDASSAAIQVRRLAQKEASSPIYKQAYRRQRQGKTPLLDMSKFSNKYKNIAKQFDPKKEGVTDEISESLKDVVRRVDAANGDLRQLHNVKMHIDRQLEKTGTDSLSRSSKRFLRDVQKDLVNNLTESSPSYRAAKSEFIRTQGPIDELQDMAIGKAAKLEDDQLDDAASKFFSKKSTPGSVVKARSVIQSQPDGKEIWNQILRREINNRMGGIKSLATQQGADAIPNLAGSMKSAIFGNPNQRDVLLRAADPDIRKNLLYLEKVLGAAASGRQAGSPTSPFETIKDRLLGRFKVAKDITTKPLDSISKAGDEGIFNRNARALGDVVFDPKYLDDMAKIRAMGINTPEAGKALNILLNNAIRESTIDQSQETE